MIDSDGVNVTGNNKHHYNYLGEIRKALGQDAEKTIEQMLAQQYDQTKESSWNVMTNPKILLPILASFLGASILTAEKKRRDD